MIMDIVGETLGELIAKERKKREEEIRELQIETTSLRSEVIELRTQLALERSKVVDMPPLPRRNMN